MYYVTACTGTDTRAKVEAAGQGPTAMGTHNINLGQAHGQVGSQLLKYI